MRRRAALLSLLALPACNHQPAWQPLPVQREQPNGEDPPVEPFFVWMNEAEADAHIVSGIAKGHGTGWRRWTSDRLSLVFKALPPGPWTARLRFEVYQRFLEDLGPFTVQLSVNGRLLRKETFTQYGDAVMDAEVPAALLQPGQDAVIDISTDKVWIAPTDGARLSLRLIAAGFVRQ